MQLGTRIQNALDELWRDLNLVAKDMRQYFNSLSDETRILFFVMFIIVIFYLIIRRPEEEKESRGLGLQFVFALAIVVIFSYGISVALEYNGMSKITRV